MTRGDKALAELSLLQEKLNGLHRSGPEATALRSEERRLIRGNIDRWLCREQIPRSFCQLIRSALKNNSPQGDLQFHDVWRFERGEFRGLDFSQWRPHPDIFLEIVHAAGMQAISHLDCRNCMYPNSVLVDFVRSPYLSSLRQLDFGNDWDLRWDLPWIRTNAQVQNWQGEIDDSGAVHLATASSLSQLTSLCLEGTKTGATTAQALASSTILKNLRCLNVACTYIPASGVSSIANATAFGKLETLVLAGHEDYWLTLEGIKQIVSSSALPALATLNAASSWSDDDSIVELSSQAGLERIRSLNVANHGISDRGILSLVNSPHLRNLTELVLWDWRHYSQGFWPNWLTLKTALSLAEDARFSQIAQPSYISQCQWYDDEEPGAALIAVGLECVSLCLDGEPDALVLLAKSPHGSRIRHLTLRSGEMGIAQLQAFCRTEGLPALQSLSFESCPIGDQGAELIASSPCFLRLCKLSFRDCSIGCEGRRFLQNMSLHAHCEVNVS